MARKKYVYEVRITVPSTLSNAFGGWLDDHIDDMLSLSYFTEAQVCAGESLDKPDFSVFVCRYHMDSPQDLQEYLKTAAPQMRSKLPAEFSGQVEYARALLSETISG